MTIPEVKTMLESITGFSTKVAFDSFPEGEAPALPFICFIAPNTNNFGADNKTYHEINHIRIELYSVRRDLTSEGLIESKLDSNDIYWDRDSDYLDDEKCYMTVYEIEV